MSSGFLRTIEVNQAALWNGVTTPPTFDLSVAKQRYKSAALSLTVPGGNYGLIGHDNEIALLQPLAGVPPLWARWFWITEVTNIIRRPAIYSQALPIIVDGQKLDRPCVHHDAPPKEAKLWRYMTLDKFEKMLGQKGIFLARADRFKDRLEGTLSPANELYRNDIYRDDPKMVAALSRLTEELSKMKHWTYVSCWRVDATESLRSWQEYASMSEGVAVQTNYGKIAHYAACIFCAKVRYVDFKATWIIEGNSLMPFMHKDREPYEWENEFRIILQKFPERDVVFGQEEYYECGKDNPHLGRVLQVDLTNLLEQIVTAPRASADFKARVERLAEARGMQSLVRSSSL